MNYLSIASSATFSALVIRITTLPPRLWNKSFQQLSIYLYKAPSWPQGFYFCTQINLPAQTILV
jgi:hypothetical protein